ncbi:hypothetical protein HDU79_009114 [Rhizoclosmatium sp. JEL0117]|nr:hypothetical protein HDU79_009114 [Rhizoclosmatium sp. JEL0117]
MEPPPPLGTTGSAPSPEANALMVYELYRRIVLLENQVLRVHQLESKLAAAESEIVFLRTNIERLEAIVFSDFGQFNTSSRRLSEDIQVEVKATANWLSSSSSSSSAKPGPFNVDKLSQKLSQNHLFSLDLDLGQPAFSTAPPHSSLLLPNAHPSSHSASSPTTTPANLVLLSPDSKHQQTPQPPPSASASTPTSASSSTRITKLDHSERRFRKENGLCGYCGAPDCPGVSDLQQCPTLIARRMAKPHPPNSTLSVKQQASSQASLPPASQSPKLVTKKLSSRLSDEERERREANGLCRYCGERDCAGVGNVKVCSRLVLKNTRT